eukprot:310523-Chlamydomonas_euryale.AAC.4
MLSAEGERVAFAKALRARGSVEGWLSHVETAMRASVRGLARRAVKEYPEVLRPAWVVANAAQLVLVTSNVYWCRDVEAALASRDAHGALAALAARCAAQLGELTALVRGGLSALARRVLSALITIDVHNRDIVDGLVAARARGADDFEWQRQLRYEWDGDEETVLVRQVQARFEYGYEYLGAQPRLVVTPMTDRCYLTLTGALHLKLGGAPAGPAGTGKTETTKDLGKALGIQCVVFNCGENLDYKV